jgi:hypothetical protein
MKIYLLLLLSLSLFAKEYQICAPTFKEAKLELSGMINSSIYAYSSSDQSVNTKNSEELTHSKVQSISSVRSHLDLVNIQKTFQDNLVCAKVSHEDQVTHTQQLLKKVASYTVKELPANDKKRVDTLELWINTLNQLEYLIPVFITDISETTRVSIYRKNKTFNDLYSKTLAKMQSEIFKTCDKTQELAHLKLQKKLFHHDKKDESLFGSFSSLFNSKEQQLSPLTFIEPLVQYHVENEKNCAFIRKQTLLTHTYSLQNESRFYLKSYLPQEPKEQINSLNTWSLHLQFTVQYMQLFNSKFKPSEINTLNNQIQTLQKIKKSINPQFVIFNIQNSTQLSIKLNNKVVLPNTKYYLKEGTHYYKIEAQNRCTLEKEFDLDENEEMTIDEDLNDYTYPKVFFISNKQATLYVDGETIAINKKVTIPTCSGKVIYTINYLDQNYKGFIDLEASSTIQKEFEFLSAAELTLFKNSKTKNFTAISSEKFSDSLTPIESEQLFFNLEDSPEHGDVDLDKSGHFVYQSEENFIGRDSFSYTVSSSQKESSTRIVHIIVKKDILAVAKKQEVALVPKVQKMPEEKKEEKVEEKKENLQAKKEAIIIESTVADSSPKESVDYNKLSSFLYKNIKNMDVLKEAQKRYPLSFKRWLQEVRSKK